MNRVLPPRLYDAVQVALGLRLAYERLAPHLTGLEGSTVLDVGGGTGLYRSLLPRSARYICLDNDVRKLARLKRTHERARALLSDATVMALKPRSVDCALCIAVSHHLDDGSLDRLFRELGRVVRTRLVFLDALWSPDLIASRVLWSLDAGDHPRSKARLLDSLSACFAPAHIESYAIYHRYLLCVASPKSLS